MSEASAAGRIHVFGDWYARADAYQWVLVRRVTRTRRRGEREGERYEDYEQVAYLPSLAALCKSVLRRSLLEGVRSGELRDLREVIKRSEQVERSIHDMVEGGVW